MKYQQEGVLLLSNGREALVVERKQDGPSSPLLGQPREEITYFDKDNSWQIEIEDFIDGIKNNKEITAGSSCDAMRTTALVEKIYKADLK